MTDQRLPGVFITGGSGLLAVNWACLMRRQWRVTLATHTRTVRLKGVGVHPLSLHDPDAFDRALDRAQPDLIVHAAGLTDVDKCEASPRQAFEANAELARLVAVAAARRRVQLVHISTDHLFSGDVPLVDESHPPTPMNEYGRSKWQAEQLVLEAHPEALVVRTNFFGWGHAARRSFSDWILDTLRAGSALTAFDDVYFTPALADRVIERVHALVARGAAGIINVCGDERVSKHEFAVRMARHFGLPESLIRRASIESAGLRAPRPRDMSLSTAKVRAWLDREPLALEDNFADLQAQEQAGRRQELLEAVQ